MSLVASYPLSTDFTGLYKLQANGSEDTGNNFPTGIPGHIEIVNGVMRATINQSDTTTDGGIRSEIIPFSPTTLNTEQWFTWEVMLDPTSWADKLGQLAISQIHQLDSITTGAVSFLLVAKAGKLMVWVPLAEPPALNVNYNEMFVDDLRFNHWYKFALHAVWKNDSTGFMEVYMDGAPIYKKWNRGTGYNLDTPYMKCGLYDSNHSAAFGTKIAYFRNVVEWSGNDGYTTVMGTTPVLPTRLIST
jgi:Polysaccharide lyase